MAFRHRSLFHVVLCAIFFVLNISMLGLFARSIGEWLLPLYRLSLEMLTPDSWRISHFELVWEGRETFIATRVLIDYPTLWKGYLIPAGVGMSGSTLLGHGLQAPLIMFTLLGPWVVMVPGNRILTSLMTLPFLLLVVMMDVPMVLAGSLWDIIHASFAPASPLPWQVTGMNLMNGGGRQALSLAAALSVIVLSRTVNKICHISLRPMP